MGYTKRIFEMVEETVDATDFDYQYEQWLEQRIKEQREAEYAAYEEMLSDIK